MTNVLYHLPSLELGFSARLEEIEAIVRSGLAVFPGGGTWSLHNLWVDGNSIVDRPSRGAYRLTQHIEWLRGHVSHGADTRKPAARKTFTPIVLPSDGDKRERLEAIHALIVVREYDKRECVSFAEGLVSFDSCRVLDDQIVVEWEPGTGHRIEATLKWLRGQINWAERQAERDSRPAFRTPKAAPRSIHPNRHLTESEKAEGKRKQAERKARVRAASMEDLAIRSKLPRPGAQAGNSVKGKKAEGKGKGRRAA